jgi:hypothetical protein
MIRRISDVGSISVIIGETDLPIATNLPAHHHHISFCILTARLQEYHHLRQPNHLKQSQYLGCYCGLYITRAGRCCANHKTGTDGARHRNPAQMRCQGRAMIWFYDDLRPVRKFMCFPQQRIFCFIYAFWVYRPLMTEAQSASASYNRMNLANSKATMAYGLFLSSRIERHQPPNRPKDHCAVSRAKDQSCCHMSVPASLSVAFMRTAIEHYLRSLRFSWFTP